MTEIKEPLLEIYNLSYTYKTGIKVLDNISCTLGSGELVSILGSNGAGKSTFFKCILGLLPGYEGLILLKKKNTTDICARELAGEVAYIPQAHYPTFNYSVLDMVLMGTAGRLSNLENPGNKEERAAEMALDRMGILHLRDRGYGQISGGEQQLVLMARALIQNAQIWILDEPTASLDYGNQIRVMKTLQELSVAGYLLIQSIHNPYQALEYSDRIIAIKDGTIIADGKPEQVMSSNLIKTLYGEDIEWKHSNRWKENE